MKKKELSDWIKFLNLGESWKINEKCWVEKSGYKNNKIKEAIDILIRFSVNVATKHGIKK